MSILLRAKWPRRPARRCWSPCAARDDRPQSGAGRYGLGHDCRAAQRLCAVAASRAGAVRAAALASSRGACPDWANCGASACRLPSCRGASSRSTRPITWRWPRRWRACAIAGGRRLLLDLHSMPPLGPKTGDDAAVDFVIGDRFGAACEGQSGAAPLWNISTRIARVQRTTGPMRVAMCWIGMVPRHEGFHAMQMEICRATYLDRAVARAGRRARQRWRELVTGLVRRLADEVARTARAASRKQPNSQCQEKTTSCTRHEVAKVQGGGAPKRTYPTRP